MAGLFALFFQLSLTFGKQLAGLSLSLFPQAPQLLFGAYTALALGCTVAMSSVIDLSARPGERRSDAGPGQPQGSGEEGSLLATLCDHRFVLLTPTNVAFGLMTALFPAVVASLAPSPNPPGQANPWVGWYFALSGLFAGCVAVAVTYMARAHPSGRALALAAGAVAFAAAAAMAGSACAALPPPPLPPTPPPAASDGGERGLPPSPPLPLAAEPPLAPSALPLSCTSPGGGAWVGIFLLYGVGVAVWQTSVMALVGEMATPRHAPRASRRTSPALSLPGGTRGTRGERGRSMVGAARAAPAPAASRGEQDAGAGAVGPFAHLKLTSALSSFVGFSVLPQVSARTACAICVAVVAVGGACLAALLYGGGAVARHRDSEPLVSSAARRSHSAAAAVDVTAQQSASA